MKNAINYYYNLIVNDIHQKKNVYTFVLNNNEYIFFKFDGNINELNEVYSFIYNNRIFCNEIIINKDGQLFTIIDNVTYILIKNNCNIRNSLKLDNIIKYTIPVYNKVYDRENWKELWSKKIDYYEYQVNQFGKKYPLIRESFSYYNGISETAISLLNLVDFNKAQLYLSHRRINSDSINEFYNPTNLIVDVKTRDAAEYFKMKFFIGNVDYIEIENYIYTSKLNKDEAIMFLSRMIYPTFYFDLYDSIISGIDNATKLEKIILETQKYEKFLSSVYLILYSIYPLVEIEWLKKI